MQRLTRDLILDPGDTPVWYEEIKSGVMFRLMFGYWSAAEVPALVRPWFRLRSECGTRVTVDKYAFDQWFRRIA